MLLLSAFTMMVSPATSSTAPIPEPDVSACNGDSRVPLLVYKTDIIWEFLNILIKAEVVKVIKFMNTTYSPLSLHVKTPVVVKADTFCIPSWNKTRGNLITSGLLIDGNAVVEVQDVNATEKKKIKRIYLCLWN